MSRTKSIRRASALSTLTVNFVCCPAALTLISADPVAFGFQPPSHLVEAATRAMRDGHNGYLPSAGIPAAREAVAADYRSRGVAMTAERVLITTGTSEAIECASQSSA